MNKKIQILLLTGLISVAGLAVAQNAALSPAAQKSIDEDVDMNESEIRIAALKAELGEGTVEGLAKRSVEGQINLAKGYRAIGREPERTTFQLGNALGKFYRQMPLAKTPQQVSQIADEASVRLLALSVAQNQRIIEQNEQIISLLKQKK